MEVRALLTGGIVVTDTEIRAPHDTVPRFVGPDAIYSLDSGDWTDPTTWSSNRVPGSNDQVRISAGTTVIYDAFDQQALDAVEVMGRLEFATDQNTSLYLNELTVLPGAALVVGTEHQPVLAQFTAEIVFTDTPDEFGNHFKTGTVDQPGIDPFQYGNGLLVFDGEVTMHGAPLGDTFVRLATEPKAGDQTLVLETSVTGWKPGDQLVIPDTRQAIPYDRPGYYTYEPQWDEVTIAAIDGTTITLAQPLLFDHLGARDADGTPTTLDDGTNFLPHVANLTRNVVIRSEDPDGVRGYTMFFRRTAKDTRYVQFQDLGRTEATTIDNTVRNIQGQITHIGTNQIGRYTDHNHHLWGPEDGLPAPPDQYRESYQVIEVGNSFTGGLKWGTAVHGTHYGLFRDNVYYDIDGAAVATEDGSETGNEFIHNFVARTNGTVGKETRAELDLGEKGDAFWLAGPFNVVEDNVATNIYRNAFTVFPTNIPYHTVKVPLFPGADMSDPSQSQVVDVRAFGQREFSGNEVYGATNSGIFIWTSGDTVAFPETGTPNVVQDTRVWHVSGVGIWFYYAAAFEIDGWIQRGDPAMIGASVRDGGTSEIPFTNIGVGHAGSRAAFSELTNADIQGMERGYLNRGRGASDEITIANSYFDNYLNIVVWKWSQTPLDGSRDFYINNVVFGDALSPGGNNTVVMDPRTPEVRTLTVPETVTISDFGGFEGQDFRVYYEEQSPAFVMPPGGCGTAIDITNQQCWDLYGLATAGEVAPTREQDGDDGEMGMIRARALGITGLVYESASTKLQPPRLYVNVEQTSNTKTAYYAVTGNTSGLHQVRLRIGGFEFSSTDLIGTFDISTVPNGAHAVVGTLLGIDGGSAVGTGATFELQLPVKDRSQFRRINQAPVLDAISVQAIRANSTLQFSIFAEDPEGDPIELSAEGMPAGATLDSTGTFRWTPTNANFGQHTIVVKATDPKGASDSMQVSIDVRLDMSEQPLLGEWKFEGNGTVAEDTSLYQQHGLINGATRVEGILQFDGTDDFVAMDHVQNHKPVEELTLAFWTKAGKSNSGDSIVAYDSGSWPGYAVKVKDSGYSLSQGYYAELRTSLGKVELTSLQVEWDEWNHVALTFKNTETSGEAKLYIDGVEVARNLQAGRDLIYSTSGTNVLRFGNKGMYHWEGQLDEVTLHGITLTAEDIQQMFEEGKASHRVNKPPVLEFIPDATVNANSTMQFVVTATDPEGAPVVYSATGLPPGATLDAATGGFEWTPGDVNVGTWPLVVTATDIKGDSSAQEVALIVQPDGHCLLGDWDFDGTGNHAIDSSDSRQNGSIHGAARSGGALVFDGIGDYVAMEMSSAHKPVEELTLAFWTRPGKVNSGDSIVTFDSGSWSAYGVKVKDSGYSPSQGYYGELRTSLGKIVLTSPRTNWDEWNHVALTFKNTETSGEARLFIDGVEVASNLAAGKDLVYSSYGTNVLRFGNKGSYFWGGSLDDVKLFGRALDSVEISALAQGRSGSDSGSGGNSGEGEFGGPQFAPQDFGAGNPQPETTRRNPDNPYDVNDDGRVTPADVLIGINELNVRGARPTWMIAPSRTFLDVTGDEFHSPADPLAVINYLNSRTSGGEGESVSADALVAGGTAYAASIRPATLAPLSDQQEADRHGTTRVIPRSNDRVPSVQNARTVELAQTSERSSRTDDHFAGRRDRTPAQSALNLQRHQSHEAAYDELLPWDDEATSQLRLHRDDVLAKQDTWLH